MESATDTVEGGIKNEESVISKSRLLVDTTFLFDQYSNRGIGRYGKEVLKRLIKIVTEEEKEWELHFAGFVNLQQTLILIGLSQFTIESAKDKIKFHSVGEPVLSSVGNLLRWTKTFKQVIEEVKPEVYYAVNFERGLPSVPYYSKKLSVHPKTIVMCHDAIPLMNNEYSPKGFIQNKIKGWFYKFMFQGIVNADVVLTNSEFSKQDIAKYGNVNPEKIYPIYLGVDESFFKESKQTEDEINHTLEAYNVFDTKYFLYDSGLEANKGVGDLLHVFKYIVENGNEKMAKRLVITGGSFKKGIGPDIKAQNIEAKNFLKEAKELGILENIITTDKVSNEDLETLLKNAFAYFNFSRYEGFSFGPVQAMAAGVPSIAANTSCLPEITDGGAFLVDTTDINKAAIEVKDFLENTRKRNVQVKKGKEVAVRYSWDNTVEKTWGLIKSLV